VSIATIKTIYQLIGQNLNSLTALPLLVKRCNSKCKVMGFIAKYLIMDILKLKLLNDPCALFVAAVNVCEIDVCKRILSYYPEYKQQCVLLLDDMTQFAYRINMGRKFELHPNILEIKRIFCQNIQDAPREEHINNIDEVLQTRLHKICYRRAGA
jgi:hypothetical protein